jgi:hypothetical protein
MSKGPGAVQQAIRTLFASNESDSHSTSEICRHVYGVKKVDKKHRVAVLRALKALAKGPMPSIWRSVQHWGREDDVWFDHRFRPLKGPHRSPGSERRPRGR